jgi:thioredoxin reductase (NADPH)
VAIVGAGDTAAEEALYLSKLCSNVHMLIRRDQMRASKIMQERIHRTANITVHWNTETEEILGEHKVEAIRLKDNKSGEVKDLAVSAFFVAIGHEPNSQRVAGYG